MGVSTPERFSGVQVTTDHPGPTRVQGMASRRSIRVAVGVAATTGLRVAVGGRGVDGRPAGDAASALTVRRVDACVGVGVPSGGAAHAQATTTMVTIPNSVLIRRRDWLLLPDAGYAVALPMRSTPGRRVARLPG